jgi:hypothetical protein
MNFFFFRIICEHTHFVASSASTLTLRDGEKQNVFGGAKLQGFGRWGQGSGFESREARTPAALTIGARRQGITADVTVVTTETGHHC